MEKKIDRTAPASRSFIWPGGKTGAMLIHGFASSLAFLSHLGRSLANRGYSIVGMRLAGHGVSLTDLDRSTAEDWIASVRLGIGLFPAHVNKLIIIGESMGALLALRLAREYSSRIHALVLLAPPFRQRSELGRRILSLVMPSRVRWRKRWINPANMAEYTRAGSLTEVSAYSYRQFLRLLQEERDHLHHLQIPTLFIFGDRDYATDPKSAQVLKSILPRSQIQIKVMAGGAHHLAYGRHGQEIEKLIVDFLKKIS